MQSKGLLPTTQLQQRFMYVLVSIPWFTILMDMFHRPAKTSSTQQLSPSHASHVVLNFRANGREDSVDSGHSSSGSFKLCAEGPYIDSSDCPVPKRTIGKVQSLDAGVSNKNFKFSKDKSITLSIDIDDPVHPDHQQFEQEEEELEDIWNHTNNYRESLNSDIIYNGYQASPDQHREPSPKDQALLFRKLVTASAPNLLVAEFRLPPSVQTMVGSGKQHNPRKKGKFWTKGKEGLGLRSLNRNRFTNKWLLMKPLQIWWNYLK